MDMGNQEETVKAALIELLAKLDDEDRLGKSGQKTIELDQQSVGRLSRMDAMQNQKMALARHQRRHLQRRRIMAALDRCDNSEFGICSVCGTEIEPARLANDPTVPLCLDCARA